jgi:hypothetical protein
MAQDSVRFLKMQGASLNRCYMHAADVWNGTPQKKKKKKKKKSVLC